MDLLAGYGSSSDDEEEKRGEGLLARRVEPAHPAEGEAHQDGVGVGGGRVFRLG